MKSKKIDEIPDDMTIEEASEFWDTHSIADYPSRMVRIEYSPEGKVTFIAISNELLKTLDQKAKKEGISVETLVNLWIQEKLISA
ncbi:MAG: CopG family antitoxin [Desulfotomaculales bacterium]